MSVLLSLLIIIRIGIWRNTNEQMCVITRWIKQEVTAMESPAAQTLNIASFVKNWSEISKEINWQEGKFKFDIPTRVWQEPLSVELDGPQWDRGSCRDPAGSGEQGPHLIVFLVLREQGSCPWFCIRLTQRHNYNTHTCTQDHSLSQRRFLLPTYCSGVTFFHWLTDSFIFFYHKGRVGAVFHRLICLDCIQEKLKKKKHFIRL